MQTRFEIGAPLETLTKTELDSSLAGAAQNEFRQFARSVKYLRFGPVSTTIASSAFSLDGSTTALGPREGFVWSIRRITVTGLTTGATPDVANLYRNQPRGTPVWQFNGNNFIYTFGKTELLLEPGETLALANLGTIAATGTVTISGDYLEVAAEEIFKLL